MRKKVFSSKRWALVGASFEGLHCWPEAPKEVWYLRNLHRHFFEVKVSIEVFHAERDIEYYMFKANLNRLVESMPKYAHFSCESYCDLIAEIIIAKYPDRDLKVSILEDGKEGALCEYEAKDR